MDTDPLLQRLMAMFVGELEDHVRSLERNLLALEKDPTPAAKTEIFATLFRTAHSLKGSARAVRLDLIESAEHKLEEIFAAARDGRRPVNADFFALLLPVVDELGEGAQRLRAGGNLVGTSLGERVRRLTTGAVSRPETAPPATPVQQATAQSQPEPQVSPVPQPPPGEATSENASSDQWSAVVRVAADKLDSLLTQSGELLIVRHRAESRIAEAGALQEQFNEYRKDWRRIEQAIATLEKRDTQGSAASATDDATGAHATLRRHLAQALIRCKDNQWRLDRSLARLASDLDADRRLVEQTTGPLDELVRRTRMLPFAEACQGLGRVARDLTAGSDKAVELMVEGGELEIDRAVLEGLKDPLMHLVRNAIDHGIEPVAARRAAGKSDAGRVTIAAVLRGSRIEVTVKDDGKGPELDRIRDQLRHRNLASADNDRDLAQSIFLPGLSTSPSVTHVSGRGVGLDVVKTRLAAMRGTVEVAFERGRGMQFTLSVPLTLTSLRAVFIGVGNQIFAVDDTVSVQRVLRVAAGDIRSIEGREVVLIAGVPVPVIGLREVLGKDARAAGTADGRMPAVVLSAGNRRAVFVVDELQAERDIMVRPLGPRLRRIEYVTGATILSDGRIALVLDAAALVARAADLPTSAGLARTMAVTPRAVRKRLLVVDDSVTIRTLEKSILEGAGYDVMTAADGTEAWQLLLEQGADLVVSDVEMPRMDGFTLTETIRNSQRFRKLPVVLVTAMEREPEKARGLAVGADAYHRKSAFDQKDLLDTIERIL